MRIIRVTYSGTRAQAVCNGVSEQIRTLRAEFVFSSDWDAYPDRTAIFIGAREKIPVLLDGDNACIVPESVSKEGFMQVGVFATVKDGEGNILRYPGEYVRVYLPQGASPDGAEPTDDQVDAYDQMLAELREATDEAERFVGEAREELEAADSAADRSTASAEEAAASAEKAEEAADRSVNGGAYVALSVESDGCLYIEKTENATELDFSLGADGNLYLEVLNT